MAKYNVKGPVDFDMEFTWGTTWAVDYECVDGEGTVIDLSGSPVVQWRLATISGTTVLTSTVGTGITVTGTATGLCSLAVTAAMQSTNGVTEGNRYQYEMRITGTSNGAIYEGPRGLLNVRSSVLA